MIFGRRLLRGLLPLALALSALLPVSCGKASPDESGLGVLPGSGETGVQEPAAPSAEKKGPAYVNPVFTAFPVPDPDVIRGEDGWFYCYSTESKNHAQAVGCPILKSRDLIHWQHAGTIFTETTHPQITDGNRNVWAPSINKVGGRYVLYYSQPAAGYINYKTGVAVSDRPTGPFVNQGVIIDGVEQNVEISIDAYLYQEGGRNYLFWGSFRKICVLELTADALSIKDKEHQGFTHVAGGQYEGSVVHHRGSYYYLICSTGNYAKGGTYKLVVGRSDKILGPYVDKTGADMKKVKHELVLEGDSVFSSPGHCSRIITDDAGRDWILYHAYTQTGTYRMLMLDRIEWDEDGWPYVPDRHPSLNAEFGPYFESGN